MKIEKETGLLSHVNLDYAKVGHQEKAIILKLGKVFLITFVKTATFKSVSYTYAFLKPTKELREKYRLQNEILVIINKHDNFDARAFDYVDKLLFEFQNRLDKLCVLFISSDSKLKDKVKKHTQQNAESRIIIPFSYLDFHKSDPINLVHNRLLEFFYGRNLFAFESPLQNDTYFYGRSDVVQFFYDKYKSGENCGLFGLRKIGKTSVLFALQRYLNLRNEVPVFLDCQEPSFHKRRWFECLEFIVQSIVGSLESETELLSKTKFNDNYDELNASKYFQEDLLQINKLLGERVLLIFDEIENITFDISPSEHWQTGSDFIYFWQSIRAVYQKNPHLFSFLIAGVNPKAIETPTVGGFDNPIYRMITGTYLRFFDGKNVKEMVSTLGNYMGLDFDEEIFTYLTEEYGGHPFLIRQVCSKIHQDITKRRPTKVSKYFYQENKDIYDRYLADYIELIVEVLKKWYPKEYHLIELLAIEDYKRFEELTMDSEKLIEHLLGYNLIDKFDGRFYIRIAAVKKYLLFHATTVKTIEKIEDKWKVVTENRNIVELQLRKTVKLVIKSNHGAVKGKDEFLKVIESSNSRKERLNNLAFDQIFNGDGEIYLDDLRKYISNNWSDFERIFNDKQLFDIYLPYINKNRIDAHAKDLDSSAFSVLMVGLNWVKARTEAFLE